MPKIEFRPTLRILSESVPHALAAINIQESQNFQSLSDAFMAHGIVGTHIDADESFCWENPELVGAETHRAIADNHAKFLAMIRYIAPNITPDSVVEYLYNDWHADELQFVRLTFDGEKAYIQPFLAQDRSALK